MEKTIIIELNSNEFILIDCLEIKYGFTSTPIRPIIEMDIIIDKVYFSDIQKIKYDKFILHTDRICCNGVLIKSIEYPSYQSNIIISLHIDYFVNYVNNLLFIKNKRKLKILNFLSNM